jgi:hypothetical protein
LTQRPDGSPSIKVLDFGISKAQSQSELDMTRTSTVMGSPRYMSPEQMRSARGVDARTDIWAIGTILYELFTGAPPFGGETMTELCAQILQDSFTPLGKFRPNCPPGLDAVISRALEKNPNHRYQNLAELAADLAPFASSEGKMSAVRVGRVLKISGSAVERGATVPILDAPNSMAGAAVPALTLNDSSAAHSATQAASQTGLSYGSSTGASHARKSSAGLIVAVVLGGGFLLAAAGGVGALLFIKKSPASVAAEEPVAASADPAVDTPEPEPSATASAPAPEPEAPPEASAAPAESASAAPVVAARPSPAVAQPPRTTSTAKPGSQTNTQPPAKPPSSDLPFSGRH